MVSVAIIDYGSGNLRSVEKAFLRAARESGHSGEIVVTADPQVLRRAGRIVLPGVGAYGDCREGLFAAEGLAEVLVDKVTREAVPFLGICVGMQLMATRGLEHGETAGFGWIPGDVVKIEPEDPALKIPHMGWNTLEVHNPHPLLDKIADGGNGQHAYFVHSYHLEADEPASVVASVGYGGSITAMVAHDNTVGTQFHPEKSQALGLQLIANFLAWKP